jgi:TPR repeat protein
MRLRSLAAVFVILLVSLPGIAAEPADFYAGRDAFQRGEYETAHRIWLALAQKGDVEAQFRVARLYVDGKGVEADATAAVKWYRLAASQGHARAQAGLGYMLHSGRGAETDIDEAIQWYRKAAEQGRASAQFNLGQIYLDGDSVPADDGQAVRWLQMAANQGYPAALAALARLHEQGRGVERNPQRAFKLWKRVAGGGDAEAEFQLGRMLGHGIGTEPNAKKAQRYYRRAASQGHEGARRAMADSPATVATIATAAPTVPAKIEPTATPAPARSETPAPAVASDMTPQQQFDRGRALLFGDGVPRDTHDAEDWFRRAAGGGHGEAAYRLGLLLYRGQREGGKAFVRAYVWLVRAAENGIGDAATWRDRVYERLSESERAEAQRLLDP